MALTAAGDWDRWKRVFGEEGDAVPGLERALVPAMLGAPEQLALLFGRLTPDARGRVRAVLRGVHRYRLVDDHRLMLLRAVTEAGEAVTPIP